MSPLGEDLGARFAAVSAGVAGGAPQARRVVARAVALRRRRAAVTALVTAALVLSASVVAWAATTAWRDPGVIRLGYATLDFAPTGDASLAVLDPAVATCGAPAPTPTMIDASEGFRIVDQSWVVGTSHAQGTQTGAAVSLVVARDDPTPLPVTLPEPAFVWVADGVVVGWSGDAARPSAGTLVAFADGLPHEVKGSAFGVDVACVGGSPQGGALEQSDYQVYPVVRLVATQETAAVVWLDRVGYGVPVAGQGSSALFVPGSWDCRQSGGAGVSALCAPAAIDGVTVDRSAETVTIPYDTDVYAHDVDVTLVGSPITVHVGPSYRWFDQNRRDLPPVPTAPDDMSCGKLLRTAPTDGADAAAGYPVEVTALRSMTRADIANGATLTLALLPAQADVAEAIAYPEPMHAWIIGWTGLPMGRGSYAAIRQVMGTATVTVADGEDVKLHRFVGASLARVSVADIDWCPGPSNGALAGITFTGPEALTIDGQVSIGDRFGSWDANKPVFDSITG